MTEKDEGECNNDNSSKRRGTIAICINEKKQEDPIVSPVPLSVVVLFIFVNKL